MIIFRAGKDEERSREKMRLISTAGFGVLMQRRADEFDLILQVEHQRSSSPNQKWSAPLTKVMRSSSRTFKRDGWLENWSLEPVTAQTSDFLRSGKGNMAVGGEMNMQGTSVSWMNREATHAKITDDKTGLPANSQLASRQSPDAVACSLL